MDDFYAESKKVKEGYRMCSSCFQTKPVGEFYRDGYTPENDIRYRRDCKECFRAARAASKKPKYLIPVKQKSAMACNKPLIPKVKPKEEDE